MAKVTNTLIYVVLKQLQEGQRLLREDVHMLTNRIASLENGVVQLRKEVALIHGDLVYHSERMDRIDARLARVETRLELQ